MSSKKTESKETHLTRNAKGQYPEDCTCDKYIKNTHSEKVTVKPFPKQQDNIPCYMLFFAPSKYLSPLAKVGCGADFWHIKTHRIYGAVST
eukprot:3153586-Amphidinium_carterae.1